ncbi:MAG: RDD family protein [Xanthomonadales bacterium]|nr:RDD family protein [Xanthomonadales bacterium]
MNPTSATATNADSVVQAGFLRRWAALFLDQLILGVAFYAVFFVVILVTGLFNELVTAQSGKADDISPAIVVVYLGMFALYYVMAGAYFGMMESSRHQATVGKMALGIKVVDAQGRRLTLAHAVGRWFAAALSYLTLYIGFLLAAFSHDKRALHDMVAGTQVVDAWAYTEHPERQSRKPGGCVIAFFVALVLMVGVFVLGILAAIAVPAYQDYRTRAQSAALWQPLDEVRDAVNTYQQNNGACPTNTSEGFGTPESYAMPGVNRIVIGEFETGYCGISVWMPPVGGTIERQFLVEFDTSEHIWYCTNKAKLKKLPDWCH